MKFRLVLVFIIFNLAAAKPDILSLQDPFFGVKPPKPLILSVILNQRAKINKVWYKKGQIVQDYIIEDIGPNFVKLNNGKKELLLKLEFSHSKISYD